MSDTAGTPSDAAVHTVVRFGVFELDLTTGELRKHGVTLKLQRRSFQLLKALVEQPGQIVTREELQRRLWPSDVFVDFESGLNTAANRLRIALGDSADNPRYVETLARTGYRFIAPVEVVPAGAGRAVSSARVVPRTRRAVASIALAVAVVLVTAMFLISRPPEAAQFRFRQVTFRRGQIWGARFAPDGHAILYTASWDNGPRQLFLTNPFSPESRSLGFNDFRLVAVSRSGELALMSFDGTLPLTGGALSRVPMNGGAPMPVDRNIVSADWSASGRLAIVRAADGANQLEFPPGTVLYKTSGSLSGLRFAPHDDRIAFIEHPVRHDNRGSVKMLEPAEAVRSLSPEFGAAGGLAWHPSGREIWVTASRDNAPKSLWAVTTGGSARPIAQVAGAMTLRDVAADGRALASRDTETLEMAAMIDGEPAVRNLSWLDWSRVADVADDGQTILFDESGVAAGPEYMVYVQRMGDRSAMRLGDGRAMALSPDGRYALVLGTEERTRFRMVPLDNGKPVELRATGLEYQWARFFPDGKRLIALANEPGRPLRLYVQPIDGVPFPITPPTVVRNVAISPEGTEVAILSADGRLAIYPTLSTSSRERAIATSEPLAPLLWTSDGWLYVQHVGAYTQIPTRISRLHLQDGRLEAWREISPTDPMGVNAITKVMISRDTRTVVFNYRRVLSELFVAEPMTPIAR